ncbi:traB domain-containing protein isoform X3 [Hetaerina americana]|uniref:traB domain-containing protein isoform X3 n=1 Tax=Hetaerina americana TaxID=62018 RepID=UPI003A7F4CF3
MENIPDPATPSVSASLYTTANASTLDSNSTLGSGLGDSILIYDSTKNDDEFVDKDGNSNGTICLDSTGDTSNSSVVEISKTSTPIVPYIASKKSTRNIGDDSFAVVIDDEPEGFNPSSEEDSELDLEDEDEEAGAEVTIGNVLSGSPSTTAAINSSLPDTVTLLSTPDGGSVYLVGTAHFSKESQEDVAQVIRAVQPHVILVELCKARVNILQLDEQTILEEAKNINFDKIKSTIQQNGLFHGIMNILLLSMSAHLTKELGMAPGGEFRRAFSEAKNVPGCVVHLGDRPIKLTLQRALASLSWWQTLKLTWHIMSKESISKEEVERCKQRDLLEEMLAELTGEFPAFSRVFVAERDLYLANSLHMAALPIHSPSSPKGYIPAKVVGVVGIGHVPGIVQHWGKVDVNAIPAIMKIPPPSLTSRMLKITMKASLLGLLVWGCVRILPIPPFSRDIARGAENSLRTIKATVQGLFQ